MSVFLFISKLVLFLNVIILFILPIHFLMQVKSKKTQSIHYGAINEFLLRGNYSGDVFATGGLVQLTLVRRKSLPKVMSLSVCLFHNVSYFSIN